MSHSHIIVFSAVKRALLIDLVGGAVLAVLLTHFNFLFGTYVAVAGALAARLSGG